MPSSDVNALPRASLLCIDDDQAAMECEKALLEASGYTVVTASSGREGLELVSSPGDFVNADSLLRVSISPAEWFC